MNGDAIGALSKRARKELGMSDRIVALIRTAVPAAVGAAATWIAKHFGVDIDTARAAAVATAGATSGYYLIVSSLERRWPSFGVLLGVPKAPSYGSSTPAPVTGDKPAPLGLEQLKDLFPPGTQIYIAPTPAAPPTSFTVTVDEHGAHVQQNPEAS